MTAPIRVGVLHDMAASMEEEEALGGTREAIMRLAIDDLVECGRLDRDVEFVHAAGLGLPAGTAFAIERAFADLAEQGVVLIVGPAIGDNALVATPLADRARIPTINWAGTERARSEFMFHLQVGSHEDESVLLARHAASLGAQRVGVVLDRSPIGRRYAAFFEAECEALGLDLATRVSIAPLAEDATKEVGAVRASGADALVYLGLGLVGTAVARARSDAGWDAPAVMNTAGLRGHDPEYARVIDGWVYLDMIADDNQVLAEVRSRLDTDATAGLFVAVGFDLGQLIAEGLARAPELTAEGVRDGLELVKQVPAAEGRSGTTLGFGHWDRGALHGPYLVLRQWRDTTSVEIPVSASAAT
jgi:ABC-type branched-subunit amino acid transport system substrate-binding protein